VQFRISDGRLEYKREYTDWKPVPTINSGSQDREAR